MQPQISIVTITFNSEKTVEETIRSVISQDYPNLEYIIIDGGSKDSTLRIVEKYRDKIASLSGSSVQGYFRSERHYFYDLQDILVKAGITQEEQAELQAALDECVLYKAATPSFLSFRIRTYCGFSMYLPSMGTDLLDSFYKEHISWNSATHLVN